MERGNLLGAGLHLRSVTIGFELGTTVAEPTAGSFDAYMSGRWAHLVRAAILLGCDPHGAEDAVQTTFAKCYFAWQKVSRTRDPDAYVHRMLINTIREARRRPWRREQPMSQIPEPTIGDHASEVAASQAVLSALKSLPSKQRQVLVLRIYADLSEARTAEVLGVPIGTVKSRMARALAGLAADPSFSNEEEDQDQ